MNEIIIDGKLLKQFDNAHYVGENGEIYSTRWKRFMSPQVNICGHLYINYKGHNIKVHRMVYHTWVEPITSKDQINHKDDNKLNNHYSNLYKGTQQQNVQDCIENGHRVSNIFKLIVYDMEKDQEITFCPANKFYGYSGHSCVSGGVQRAFTKNWFNKRYKIIEYKRIKNLDELKGVETMADECKPVR